MSFDVHTLIGRRATNVSNRMSMGDILRRVASSRPDQTALVVDADATETGEHTRISYGEAADIVDRVASGLQASGLQVGDICVMVCENSAEALLTKIALARAGIVVAPLNPSLADEVVARLFDRLNPRALITDRGLLHRFTAEQFASSDLVVPYAIAVGDTVDPGHHGQPEYPTFAEFSMAHDPAVQEPEIAGDDIWQLLFTSGSTSDPKAAMVSHANTYVEGLAWTTNISRGLRSENDTVLGTGLPMIYHVGDALIYASWFNSGTVVLARKPDPTVVAQLISEEGVTTLWGGLPQFLRYLIDVFEDTAEYDLSSLRAVIFGWAPLDQQTFDRYQNQVEHEIDFAAIIGQTEVVVAHRFWLNEHPELISSEITSDNYIGLPHASLRAAIFDTNDGDKRVTEQGETGEARYQSPAVLAGYYKDEDATREALGDGWFRSGDVFGIGANQQRIMLDRLKDVIKSGGENVSSIRVEAVLETHDQVQRAAVIGKPDARWGEAVTAVVVPKENGTVTEDELIAYSKDRLARFEVPKAVIFVDSLPTSAGGKLQKFRILDQISQK